jgi:hypothetical protein
VTSAKEGTSSDEEGAGSDATQANNSLADCRALNVQNYDIPELSGGVDAAANNFVLRDAQPFGKWLMRASLPFLRVPTGPESTQSGVVDADVFFGYLFDTGNPARSFGVGPQLVFDTASETATGAGKTQAGCAAAYFDGSSQFLQWGGLLTYRTDIAGSSERLDTSVLAARPFYFFQLGKGNYVRVAPIWVFDLENDTCHVPVGLGFGKVVPTEKVVFNFFVEPQFTILSKGAGQPEFQPFIAVNIQFKRSRACRAWLARRALCCRSSYRGRP